MGNIPHSPQSTKKSRVKFTWTRLFYLCFAKPAAGGRDVQRSIAPAQIPESEGLLLTEPCACFWLNAKSQLFSISARKTALYLAVHRKNTPPARKSGLFMAITGTKQAERALWRSARSLLWAAGWRICQLRCPAPYQYLHELFARRQ